VHHVADSRESANKGHEVIGLKAHTGYERKRRLVTYSAVINYYM